MKKYIRLCAYILCLSLLLSGCQDHIPENTTVPTSSPAETQELTFSAESGVYEQAFSLHMIAGGNAQILYTLDGSDPVSSSTVMIYTEPLTVSDRSGDKNIVSAVNPVLFAGSYNKPNSTKDGFICTVSAPQDEDVDKCTVVRAVAKYADGTYSPERSAVYFIGSAEQHIPGLTESCEASGTSLAVISICMNYEDLFDSTTGIYVKGDIFETSLLQHLQYNKSIRDGETARSLDANYKQRGREWERNASITMLEVSPDGTQTVLSQQCGIRIQGNYSRSDVQKGFRLFARDEYGDNNFRYAVFGQEYLNDAGEVMDKFKSLVLRAGGNCAFTAKFNDTYWQSLLQDTACETKRSRPCVVYLNGEYWGLYVLEEDYTDDYFEDLHGVNKDDVVIYKGDAESYEIGYKLDEGEIPEGEEADYYFRELLDFFDTHEDLKSQEDYEAFIQLVDPQSVMDYFAVQCWINNKWDWPGKNWSMWRTTTVDESNPYGDGRWRFMFYDMEFGGVSGESDARTNTIKEDNYKPLGLLDRDTDNPAVLCFVYLMTNTGFREGFCLRLKGLSSTILEQDQALAQLQHFQDMYAPLYDQFYDRYPGTGSAHNAINGGYASIRCIRDFLAGREGYIQNMIDYVKRVMVN